MKHKPAFTLALALAGASAFALTAQAQSNGVGVGASIDVEEVSSKVVFSDTVVNNAVVNGLPSPEFRVHVAKFVCGQVPADKKHPEKPGGEFAFEQHALTPGTYLTAINIFNPNLQTVEVEKFVSLAAAERVGDDGPVSAGDMDDGEFVGVVLEGGQSVEIDCITITTELLDDQSNGQNKNPVDFDLLKGFVVPIVECGQVEDLATLQSTDFDLFLDIFCPELKVTAVYTYKNIEPTEDKDKK
jgi:hypothetical protein